MAAGINYSMRDTDYCNRGLINSILREFYSPSIFRTSYTVSLFGYYWIAQISLQNYKIFIDENLPLNDRAEIFGLHKNSELTSIKNTNNLLE